MGDACRAAFVVVICGAAFAEAHEEPFQVTLTSKPFLCLDLPGGDAKNGAPIQIWPCNGLLNQLWWFDTGSYQIEYAGGGDKCIDAGGAMQGGTQLMLWDCNGLPQQKWSYDSKASRVYLANSPKNCMDLAGGDTKWGNKLQLWACNGLANQQWSLRAGITIRMRKSPNSCLDLYGGKTDNGTPINIWDCNGMDHQFWFFDPGAYQIQYAGDRSKCIDAGNGQPGAKLMLWDCNGLAQQRWGYDSKQGTVFLDASASDATICIDLTGGVFHDGTPVQTWTCNGCWNQQFEIIGPSYTSQPAALLGFETNAGSPNGCPPVPSPPPPPAPPGPKPAAGNFLPACKSPNQYGWPKFDDQKSLSASPWGGYFKDVYGFIPVQGYPICTFDFWFLYESKIKKNNIKTPTAITPGKGTGIVPGTWFQTQWSLQPADASWIKHVDAFWTTIKTGAMTGGVPDNTWVEISHHQVGTPAAGDELHGSWFVIAPGTNLWFNTGKTMVFKNHGDGATKLCGHTANDPQTAQCAVKKGLDSYQFIYAAAQGFGISDFHELVASKRNGGYPCTTTDVKHAFRVGWQAALSCTCNNADPSKNSNCIADKHSDFSDFDPASWRYGIENTSSLRSTVVV